MKRFLVRRLISILCASGLLGASTQVFASAFQLWEQDGASVGNYHAGYAALANDASTAWYNPAGITRIKNQQIVFGAVGIVTDFKYKGTVNVNTLGTANYPVTAQGGVFSFVPALHYVTPLTDTLGFGFSVDVPFGLKTDYGNSTFLRYAATETSVTVVDISPSLGLQATEKFSVGFGFDIQRMYAEFDSVGVLASPVFDTTSTNKANDTGYGMHAGALYQFTPDSRIGLSYHSQVVHHLTGNSRFEGPLATEVGGGTYTSHAATSVRLPAYTALSFYHKFRPQVALMGSVIYTQWNVFKDLLFQGISGIQLGEKSQNIEVIVPEHYRNTWSASVGADYYATDRITLRGGLGYDETPVVNGYRDVRLPDNNRYVIALGGHYQATKAIGLDLGWTHLFIKQARVNPPPQAMGDQVVITDGHVNGGADVYSAQLTWDIV